MNDITTLRNCLFLTLDRLSSAKPEELDHEMNKASSIVQVADMLIKTAEVENEFISVSKCIGSGFIPGTDKSLTEIGDGNGNFNVDKKKNWLTGDNSGRDTEI